MEPTAKAILNLLEQDRDYLANVRATGETLIELKKICPPLPGCVYNSPYEFLLKHGKSYPPGPWTRQYPRGANLMCYGNAVCLGAMHGLKYIEGVAVAPTGQMIPHAWNADREDELIDCTWCNTGIVYIGVEFSIERADDATWNGDACVLNDEHRNYPVFQKPWKGEDYTLTWPYSDRLEALRRRDKTDPPSVAEWLNTEDGRRRAPQRGH